MNLFNGINGIRMISNPNLAFTADILVGPGPFLTLGIDIYYIIIVATRLTYKAKQTNEYMRFNNKTKNDMLNNKEAMAKENMNLLYN